MIKILILLYFAFSIIYNFKEREELFKHLNCYKLAIVRLFWMVVFILVTPVVYFGGYIYGLLGGKNE